MLRFWCLAAVSGAALAAAGSAFAQYPDKPITLTVQAGPGAQTDTGARTLVPFLEACLGGGATVIVQNMPGSNGDINNTFLAQAEPDGYTIGIVNVPGVIANGIAEKRDYSIDSYDYLGALTGGHVMISVRRDSEWKTLDELVQHMKESGEPMLISSGGKGTSEHLALLQFERLVPGIKFTLIPFNDAAVSLNAVIGGHVQATAASGAETMQEQLRTLGIALAERLPSLPDVPTFSEQGVELVGGSNHVYAAPKGTPPEIVEKLSSCVTAAAENPKYREQAETRGLTDIRMTAEEAEEMIREKDKVLREIWAANPWID